MATIITRAGKGSPLTHTEVDANFTNLNTDKLEASDLTAGAGISIAGTTVTNAAPDQIVTITGSGIVSVSGTYPNFEVAATALQAADIGVSVQAYDANLAGFVSAFTLPTTDGTNGQFLATDGAGNLALADVAGGGSWEYISTSTASNAASVTITLPAGYIALMVRLGNISCSAVNQLRGRFNASHQMRTNLLAGWFPSVSNDANGTTLGVRLVNIDRGFTYGSPWRTQGQIIINQGYDSSSTFSSIYSQVSAPNQNVLEFNIASGISETAAVDTSFQIYPSTGTFSGTFALYALKNS